MGPRSAPRPGAHACTQSLHAHASTHARTGLHMTYSVGQAGAAARALAALLCWCVHPSWELWGQGKQGVRRARPWLWVVLTLFPALRSCCWPVRVLRVCSDRGRGHP